MVNNIDKEKKSNIINFIDKRINTNNNSIHKHIRIKINIIKSLKLQRHLDVAFGAAFEAEGSCSPSKHWLVFLR
jgi:hypothetical protein